MIDALLGQPGGGCAWSGRSPPNGASLDALNRLLSAYLKGEYHLAPHRGLHGNSPLEQWTRSAEDVRYVDPPTPGYNPRRFVALISQIDEQGSQTCSAHHRQDSEAFEQTSGRL